MYLSKAAISVFAMVLLAAGTECPEGSDSARSEPKAVRAAVEEKLDAKSKPALDPKVCASLDRKDTLVLVVANNGKKLLETTPVLTNRNYVTVTDPGNKTVTLRAWKKGVSKVTIAPSKTRTWEVTVGQLKLYGVDFKRKGLYRVLWHVEGRSSAPLFLSRGEEKK